MKLTYKPKNLIELIILLVAGVIFAHYIEKFINGFSFEKNCAKDASKLTILIITATSINDTSIFGKYSDSCVSYLNKCPDNEIDSIKSIISFYLKFHDDFTSDIINSIKDSGKLDTSNIFRALTKAELRELCIKYEENYSNFNKNINSVAITLQQKRDEMIDKGNSKETTYLYRDQLILSKKRYDSIYQLLYNRMFSLKK